MTIGKPLKAPSFVLQTVCPYCEMSLAGSMAHTELNAKKSHTTPIRIDRGKFDFSALTKLALHISRALTPNRRLAQEGMNLA